MAEMSKRQPVPMGTRIKAPLLGLLAQSKYLAIWVTFVLLMVLTPFTKGPIGAIILSIIFSLILISGILTVSDDRRLLVIGLIPLTIALITRWTSFLIGETELQAVSALFATITLAYITVLVFSSLFKAHEVTTVVIWQAISVYLLIGLTWASLFLLVELLSPGSLLDSLDPSAPMAYPAIVYYSFVTLATLGYGDITPMTTTTRGLAVLEVLTGVLFMAILISRLVGVWKPGKKGE
ncbi:MAG: ion channel [Methanomassiliicoccus sp.]|nr:ion channel [Methanomassiliicoccus sp.]